MPLFKTWTEHLGAWLDRRVPQMLEEIAKLSKLAIYDDPEALFQEGWLLCDVGAHEQGHALPRARRRSRVPGVAGVEARAAIRPAAGTPAFESLLADAEAAPAARARRLPRRRRGAPARPPS